MGVKEGGVCSKIGRATRIGLYIDTPFVCIQAVSLEGTSSAEVLDLVDEFVATIVAIARETFRVLVGESGAKGFDDSLGGEVF